MYSLLLCTLTLLFHVTGAVVLTFTADSQINWDIDLQRAYPNGIFCSKIEVFLVEQSPLATRALTEEDEHPDGLPDLDVVRVLNGKKVGSSDGLLPFEIGNHYRFTWTLPELEAGRYRLFLTCIQPSIRGSDSRVVTDMNLLAASHDFYFQVRSNVGRSGITSGRLLDLTPIAVYSDENTIQCRGNRKFGLPIRSEGGDYHDLDTYLMGAFENVEILPCGHYRIDEQMMALISALTDQKLRYILQNKVLCPEQFTPGNLKTEHVWKHGIMYGRNVDIPHPPFNIHTQEQDEIGHAMYVARFLRQQQRGLESQRRHLVSRLCFLENNAQRPPVLKVFLEQLVRTIPLMAVHMFTVGLNLFRMKKMRSTFDQGNIGDLFEVLGLGSLKLNISDPDDRDEVIAYLRTQALLMTASTLIRSGTATSRQLKHLNRGGDEGDEVRQALARTRLDIEDARAKRVEHRNSILGKIAEDMVDENPSLYPYWKFDPRA